MYNDLRGKVKEAIWNRSVCTDNSDPLPLRRKARKDFWKDCHGEGGSADNVSSDMIEEALELGEEGIR